jgi:hypothetical protein
MDESRHALRVLGVRKSFEEAVGGAQNGKRHFGRVDQGSEAFMVALAGLAEEHSLDAAAGSQSFFDQARTFDTDEAVFGGQAAAQSYAKFLEPAIVAAGQKRSVTRGARVAGGFSRRGHHRRG